MPSDWICSSTASRPFQTVAVSVPHYHDTIVVQTVVETVAVVVAVVASWRVPSWTVLAGFALAAGGVTAVVVFVETT
eukprot:scaffold29330_cov56-Attheya_sp.AAC.8